MAHKKSFYILAFAFLILQIAVLSAQDYMNEPSGFEKAVDRHFDSLNDDGWIYRQDEEFTITIDETAPKSPGNVGQALFPAGLQGGNEPIATDKSIESKGFESLYISFFIKVSENWQGHPIASKIGYVWIHEDPVLMFVMVGENQNPLYSQVRVQHTPEGNDGAINFPSNINNVEIKRGQWHQWEALLISNNPGQSNGEIHWWIDGKKAGVHKGIMFSSDSENNVWGLVAWRPVWGGSGSKIQENQYMWIDHYYASGSDKQQESQEDEENAEKNENEEKSSNSGTSSDNNKPGTGLETNPDYNFSYQSPKYKELYEAPESLENGKNNSFGFIGGMAVFLALFLAIEGAILIGLFMRLRW